jgi:hypothetical protein
MSHFSGSSAWDETVRLPASATPVAGHPRADGARRVADDGASATRRARLAPASFRRLRARATTTRGGSSVVGFLLPGRVGGRRGLDRRRRVLPSPTPRLRFREMTAVLAFPPKYQTRRSITPPVPSRTDSRRSGRSVASHERNHQRDRRRSGHGRPKGVSHNTRPVIMPAGGGQTAHAKRTGSKVRQPFNDLRPRVM